MKSIETADSVRYPRMTTQELRESFLLTGLSQPGQLAMNAVDLDRAVVGMAIPLEKPIALPGYAELRAAYFTERREVGVLNIGGAGTVRVGEKRYELRPLDVLYVGRGNPEVVFESADAKAPAVFYLLSFPAHAEYPVALVRKEEARPMEMGSLESCNRRTIYKYIHLEGARSCQLVMGVTHLEPGSNWNTMPAHTHDRRCEIYLYFNVAPDARVFHLMGPAAETRHLVVADREVAVSPGWSVHSGVGTRAYSFCWGMGGENQDYADMDPATLETVF